MHPVLKSYISQPCSESITQLLLDYQISDHDLTILKMISGKIYRKEQYILMWKNDCNFVIIRLIQNRCILYKTIKTNYSKI
jgi:hypothetical protein